MQPPVSIFPRRPVTKQPVARAIGRFDPVVVANEIGFAIAHPPFAVDALGAIGARHPMPDISPDEETRRMVRQPKRKMRSSVSGRRFALKSWTKDRAIPEGWLRQLDLYLMLGTAPWVGGFVA